MKFENLNKFVEWICCFGVEVCFVRNTSSSILFRTCETYVVSESIHIWSILQKVDNISWHILRNGKIHSPLHGIATFFILFTFSHLHEYLLYQRHQGCFIFTERLAKVLKPFSCALLRVSKNKRHMTHQTFYIQKQPAFLYK